MDKIKSPPFIRLNRKRSAFIKNEKIFEYFQGHLGNEEHEEIKLHIESSQEAQNLIKCFEASETYTETLKGVYISQELSEKIRHYHNFWAQLYQKVEFKNWPQSFRLFVESFVLAGVVFAALTVTPWSRVRDWWKLSFEKVSFTRQTARQENINPAHDKPAPILVPLTADQKSKATVAQSAPTLPPPSPPIEQNPVVTVAPPDAEKTIQTRSSQGPKLAREGYLYRLFMKHPNLDVVTIQIVEQIRTMGGEKAGEVPLGWRRSQPSKDGQGEVQGSYFHFTLPEENLEPLFARLKSYGTLEVNKENHPRVMPEGTERFILWIESAAPTGSAKKTAPISKSSPVNSSSQNADQSQATPSPSPEPVPVEEPDNADTPQE